MKASAATAASSGGICARPGLQLKFRQGQKVRRSANWMARGALVVDVMKPKVELVAVRFGEPNTGRLVRLNDSARNCTLMFSWITKLFVRLTLKLFMLSIRRVLNCDGNVRKLLESCWLDTVLNAPVLNEAPLASLAM